MSRNASLFIAESPLLVLPTLAALIALSEAIVLQQVHYWLCKLTAHIGEGLRWTYNSYPQWRQPFPFWTVSTIKRIFLNLERQGVVLSRQFDKRSWNRCKWYTIDSRRLAQLLYQAKSDGHWLSPRGGQHEPFEESRLASLMGAICAAIDDPETSFKITPETSSSATANVAADEHGDHRVHVPPIHGTERDELHPDVVALVRSMVTTAFHGLAEPTRRHEIFWDAQLDLIHT